MPPKPNRPKLTGEAQMLHDVFNGSAIKGSALKASRKILGETFKEDDKSNRWDLQAYLNHLGRLEELVIKAEESGRPSKTEKLLQSLVDSICSDESGVITTRPHDIARQNQKDRIDSWVSYLAFTYYPTWFKFYAIRSMLTLKNKLTFTVEDGERKDQHFKKRDEQTLAPFPELNQEALAKTYDEISKALSTHAKYANMPSQENPDETVKYVYGITGDNENTNLEASFNRIYAKHMDNVTANKEKDNRRIRKGKWVTYTNNATKLANSVDGYSTGWCIASMKTAKVYLNRGEVKVFYSIDPDKPESPYVPRLCIRYEDKKIVEVRGVDPAQGVEDEALTILMNALKDINAPSHYMRLAIYQKLISSAYKKHEADLPLNEQELKAVLLHGHEPEMIYGFGYRKNIEGLGENQLYNKVKKMQSERDRFEDFHSLYKFQYKNQEIAYDHAYLEYKLSEDEIDIQEILNNSKLSRRHIAGRLVQIRKGYILAENVNLFDELDQGEVAQVLIGTSQAEGLIENLHNFTDLDHKTLCKTLFSRDYHEAIMTNVDMFDSSVHKDIAYGLMRKNYSYQIAHHISKYDIECHEYIAELFVKFNRISDLLPKINEFHNVNQKELLTRIIEAGKGNNIAYNLEVFNGTSFLDLEIAKSILNSATAEYIAKGINNFNGLDDNFYRDLSSYLIKSGNTKILLGQIKYFKGLEYKEIFRQIISSGAVKDLSIGIKYFEDLDQESASVLIAEGSSIDLLDNYEKFNILDSRKILEEIIYYGDGEIIADKINFITGITHQEVADMLIEAGKLRALARNAHKFEGLNEDTINRLEPYLKKNSTDIKL